MPTLARWFLGFLLATLWGCSSRPVLSPEELQRRQSSFKPFLLQLRTAIQQSDLNQVESLFSRRTLLWLEDMRHASHQERKVEIESRPYFEAVAILALRLERRYNLEFDDSPRGVLQRLVVSQGPVRRSLLHHQLAPAQFRGDQALVGLLEAPSVPVFYFDHTLSGWKLDLVESLPLIMRGAEDLARQRHRDVFGQAVWTLETATGRRFEQADLL